jgi:hypothetical protein
MYQVPIDMMMRITSVAFATMSLPRQSASRPYGLSTTSVDLVAFAGAGAGAVAAAGAAGVAGVVAAGASLPCACASGTSNATAANTIAASAAQRVIFNMVSPDWVLSDRIDGIGDVGSRRGWHPACRRSVRGRRAGQACLRKGRIVLSSTSLRKESPGGGDFPREHPASHGPQCAARETLVPRDVGSETFGVARKALAPPASRGPGRTKSASWCATTAQMSSTGLDECV